MTLSNKSSLFVFLLLQKELYCINEETENICNEKQKKTNQSTSQLHWKKTNIYSACKKVSLFVRSPNVQCRVHKTPLLTILSQIKSIRNPQSTFLHTRTNFLTPWSRVLLEKLTGLQLVNKFPAFYGTRRCITAFTIARHLFLSSSSSIQAIPPHPTS
jgi:hypothetical protein